VAIISPSYEHISPSVSWTPFAAISRLSARTPRRHSASRRSSRGRSRSCTRWESHVPARNCFDNGGRSYGRCGSSPITVIGPRWPSRRSVSTAVSPATDAPTTTILFMERAHSSAISIAAAGHSATASRTRPCRCSPGLASKTTAAPSSAPPSAKTSGAANLHWPDHTQRSRSTLTITLGTALHSDPARQVGVVVSDREYTKLDRYDQSQGRLGCVSPCSREQERNSLRRSLTGQTTPRRRRRSIRSAIDTSGRPQPPSCSRAPAYRGPGPARK